ncbi:reticuline oxidase-like [Abeliophyllum distichum]|uniref:Reticuline oxidase-like n=1 Tax=Abeliophyllum distichum TaxID=126358 RepID=A0ABD1Q2G4_9LAMI
MIMKEIRILPTMEIPVFIDMMNLSRVSVDVKSQVAWVESGAILGQTYYSISESSRVHGFPGVDLARCLANTALLQTMWWMHFLLMRMVGYWIGKEWEKMCFGLFEEWVVGYLALFMPGRSDC